MDSTRDIKSYDTREHTIRRDNIGMVWRVLDHTIDMAREVSGRDDMRITLRRESDTTHFLREYIMESPHKHHIIPRYHCKELGIDPDFDDNFVTIERIEHAQIHWEYFNGGYETLLKYIKPKPYVLMNIPFGDKRDKGAAVVTGKGEIDGIDMSGENHPRSGEKSNFYKDGRCGALGSIERKRYQQQFSGADGCQSKPREEYGWQSYRQVYYKENKERLDEMMKRSAEEWTCVRRIEKLIILIENEKKRFGHIDDIFMDVSHEVERITDYISKYNLDPEILLSYDLFDKY